MVLRKNEIVKGQITDLNDDGQGVLKIDDNIIFVPNTIPGEEIEAIIIKSFTKYSIAKLIGIYTNSLLNDFKVTFYFFCDMVRVPALTPHNDHSFSLFLNLYRKKISTLFTSKLFKNHTLQLLIKSYIE